MGRAENRVLKKNFGISSMQEMTEKFNEETIIRNICKIVGKEERGFLPYYITINGCLEKLEPKKLEKLRTKITLLLTRNS